MPGRSGCSARRSPDGGIARSRVLTVPVDVFLAVFVLCVACAGCDALGAPRHMRWRSRWSRCGCLVRFRAAGTSASAGEEEG